MDNTRLANIIFQLGVKIPQCRYEAICESIEKDSLSFDKCVFEYKLKESIMDKVVFVLNDGTKILISEELFNNINCLNSDKTELSKYMSESYENFKNIVGLINGNQ